MAVLTPTDRGLYRLSVPGQASSGTDTVNSAAIRVGLLFTADRSASLTGFLLRIPSTGGTPTNALQANLYLTDSNHEPTGSSLATLTATPTSGSFQTFTWSSAYSVTSGVEYVIVIQNVDGTPATNLFRIGVAGSPIVFLRNLVVRSHDTAASWFASADALSALMFLSYAGGTVGVPFANGSVATSGAPNLYNTSGSRVARVANLVNFDKPALLYGFNITGNFWATTGSPTHFMRGEVCSSSALLSTSNTRILPSTTNINRWVWWETPYELAADTDYYIGVTPDGATAGDASNYFNAPQHGSLQTPTLAVLEAIFLGAYQSTASPGPTWSSLGTLLGMTLILGPAEVGGGSSGIRRAGGMAGGINRSHAA